jgi:hypothetical protein
MKYTFNKMTTNLLIVAALVFSVSDAKAKKVNFPFEVLIGMSDVIVTGRIASVSGDTAYLFTIDEAIKGVTPHQIRVKMFQDWACDVRLKKAQVGQELFLFLKQTGNTYTIINGSDGEMFIAGYKLLMTNPFNYYSREYFDEANSPKITDVVSSIRNFVKCFSFSFSTGEKPRIRQLKTEKEINALKTLNPFSIWLYKRLTDRPEYHKIISAK